MTALAHHPAVLGDTGVLVLLLPAATLLVLAVGWVRGVNARRAAARTEEEA